VNQFIFFHTKKCSSHLYAWICERCMHANRIWHQFDNL